MKGFTMKHKKGILKKYLIGCTCVVCIIIIAVILYVNPSQDQLAKRVINNCKNSIGQEEDSYCSCISYTTKAFLSEEVFKEWAENYGKNSERASATRYKLDIITQNRLENELKECWPKLSTDGQIKLLYKAITKASPRYVNCLENEVNNLSDIDREMLAYGMGIQSEKGLQKMNNLIHKCVEKETLEKK